MSATVEWRHFGCTRNTIERLQRRFLVTENVADRPRSGRPRVTTAADDRYIALQHIRNRRLIAAATRIHYGIYAQAVRNLSLTTDLTSFKFSPDVIKRQDGIGAAVTCTSNKLIGI